MWKQLAGTTIALVMVSACGGAKTERLSVAFPEQWPENEPKNCYMLPMSLDCDRFVKGEVLHFTPQDRFLRIDVSFDGPMDRSMETTWTCERTGNRLSCKR